MGGNALIYKVIISAVFFLTSFVATQSFSEVHKNDAVNRDKSITKAIEAVTSNTYDRVSRADDPVSPKKKNEKTAQVQDVKLLAATLKAEEEHNTKKSEKSLTAKTKAKKGKSFAKASRSAKQKAKHKRRAKAKAAQKYVAAVKVEDGETVTKALPIEKQEQVGLASVKVEDGSKAAPKVGDSPLTNATFVKDEAEPHTKPAKSLFQVGQAVPNLSIVTESGHKVALEDYRGNVLVLNFFEPGCQTCRSYLPHFKELNSKFGKQGLQIIDMSTDQNPTKAEFGIQAVPVVFVVDAHGRVAGVFKVINNQTHSRIENLVKVLLKDLYKIPA